MKIDFRAFDSAQNDSGRVGGRKEERERSKEFIERGTQLESTRRGQVLAGCSSCGKQFTNIIIVISRNAFTLF